MKSIQNNDASDSVKVLPKWLYDQAEIQAIEKFNKIIQDIELCSTKCKTNIISETAPIFVISGCQSYLAGILLGKRDSSSCATLNIFMIPPNYVTFSSNELSVFSNRDIYFLTSNISCNNANDEKLLKDFEHQLGETAKSVSIIDLVEFMDEHMTDYHKGELDLSIAVKNWRNQNSDDFVNLLIYFCQRY